MKLRLFRGLFCFSCTFNWRRPCSPTYLGLFFCFKLRCLWTSHKFLKVLHTIFSAGRLRAVLTANLGTLSFISWRCCMGFLPQTSPQIAKTRRHIFSYLYSTLKAWRKGALTVLDFKTKHNTGQFASPLEIALVWKRVVMLNKWKRN